MKNFETVSFHIVKPCNFSCKFCYATFQDFKVGKQMPIEDAVKIVDKLRENGVQKITFAGGEPLLYKHLIPLIIYSKRKGITTSIITNGSLLTPRWLIMMHEYLDWIGISIDSLSMTTNKNIGRGDGQQSVRMRDYINLLMDIEKRGYKLKINTVVNAYNKNEDFHDLITAFKVDRWKVFQALRVEGQNEKQFDEVKVTDDEFENFVIRHRDIAQLVPENNKLMTGSYLLIDPLGRMFENSEGKHTYSDSLIDHSYDHCISQIKLNRNTFIERGGIYKW